MLLVGIALHQVCNSRLLVLRRHLIKGVAGQLAYIYTSVSSSRSGGSVLI